ncbi:hypothetical protein [Pseudomonas guariconensis]|uniref:hypothetical protein n=1 Tax=Pseudomonas guariconensis TaxID=1288410 RepID=UPI0018A8A208|nr:hypothetical protein [Pseudomonas guariconensis]MBF8754685.1 hypothetical protein [Pseudomonas guariconensis]
MAPGLSRINSNGNGNGNGSDNDNGKQANYLLFVPAYSRVNPQVQRRFQGQR